MCTLQARNRPFTMCRINLGARVTIRRRACYTGSILGLALWLSVTPGLAQVTAVDSTPPLFRTHDLTYAALFFGSLLAIESFGLIDGGLSPNSHPTGFAGSLYDAGDVLGNGYVAVGLGGAALLGGELFGNSRLSRIGLRSLGAIGASTLIVLPAKVIIGRRRPYAAGTETDEFDSFTFSREFYSFPSGHTSSVFALATVVSDEFAEHAPWVAFVAYPVAFLAGASRIVGRQHWLTDVVAGAAAGVFAAKVSRRWFGVPEVNGGAGPRFQPLVSTGADGWAVGLSATVR